MDQIRTTVCINNVPVKIVGAHAGLGAGPCGSTHQALEDIAIMRTLPNIIVEVPCDFEKLKATRACKQRQTDIFKASKTRIRNRYQKQSAFKIGRAEILKQSKILRLLLSPAELWFMKHFLPQRIGNRGIETLVINNHTVKPMDERTIIRAAKTTGSVVTCEGASNRRGMGSAVAEISRNFPFLLSLLVPNCFGESGKQEELINKFKMSSKDIIEAVKKVILRKILRGLIIQQ